MSDTSLTLFPLEPWSPAHSCGWHGWHERWRFVGKQGICVGENISFLVEIRRVFYLSQKAVVFPLAFLSCSCHDLQALAWGGSLPLPALSPRRLFALSCCSRRIPLCPFTVWMRMFGGGFEIAMGGKHILFLVPFQRRDGGEGFVRSVGGISGRSSGRVPGPGIVPRNEGPCSSAYERDDLGQVSGRRVVSACLREPARACGRGVGNGSHFCRVGSQSVPTKNTEQGRDARLLFGSIARLVDFASRLRFPRQTLSRPRRFSFVFCRTWLPLIDRSIPLMKRQVDDRSAPAQRHHGPVQPPATHGGHGGAAGGAPPAHRRVPGEERGVASELTLTPNRISSQR